MTADTQRAPASLAFRWVLMAYLAGISGFGRAFSRLHVDVAGLPLFSGEVAIALLAALGAVCLWRTRARALRREGAVIAVVGFLAVGCVYALVGLSRGFGVAALRDFALVYYASFFVFALLFVRLGGSPALVVAAVVAGAGAGAAWRVARFAAAPELAWGHGAPGFQAIVAWVAVLGVAALAARSDARWRRLGGLLAVACCAAVVFLSAQRSLLAAIGAVAAGAACLLATRGGTPARRVLATALAALALWVGATAVLAVRGRPLAAGAAINGAVPLSDALAVIAARWVDPGLAGAGLVGLGAAPATGRPPAPPGTAAAPVPRQATGESTARSAGFRLQAWRNAWSRIAASPLVGIGFGPSPNLFPDEHCMLVTSPTSNCGNAHNTYLTLAMRMGLPILAAFLLANLVAVVRALRALAGTRDAGLEALLVFSLAAVLSLGAYAGLGMFLESPYLSSLYWVVLGLMHETTARAKAAVSSRPAPAATARA